MVLTACRQLPMQTLNQLISGEIGIMVQEKLPLLQVRTIRTLTQRVIGSQYHNEQVLQEVIWLRR